MQMQICLMTGNELVQVMFNNTLFKLLRVMELEQLLKNQKD